METPHILVIDDSRTILKMVECHLSQAGYRVSIASDAEQGIEAAAKLVPDLILLDHQLPGTTGDEVCRRLLDHETTARIPVVISSAMRNRAFASYTDFPNVVDQIPKPFTPDLLRTGVANALQVGAMVIQAQQTGCAMPEAVGEVQDPGFEGRTSLFPLNSILDFLNNGQYSGKLTLEVERDRIRFHLSSGRIQAIISPTVHPERVAPFLRDDQADLAPLLPVTLSERMDPSMSGLVRLLERSLSDPRRLRSLLRTQAAILTHFALTSENGRFTFEPDATLPPMFQAFPLQVSLPALSIEGIRLCDPTRDPTAWSELVLARNNPRGGNPDRAGLNPIDLKIHSLLDGSSTLAAIAELAKTELESASDFARGMERVGLVERRRASTNASILAFEDDPEAIRTLQRTLGPQGEGVELKIAHDKVSTQLLLRRSRFDLLLIGLDRPDMDSFLGFCRKQAGEHTRIIGITGIEGEDELTRLDALGIDGVLHRPLVESDLLATVRHLLAREQAAVMS